MLTHKINLQELTKIENSHSTCQKRKIKLRTKTHNENQTIRTEWTH